MPRIWYNSNSNTPEDAVRNEVEINAAVAYLFANSEKNEFDVKAPIDEVYKASILADTLEAVIGAVYLDQGLDAASQLVHHLFDPLIE